MRYYRAITCTLALLILAAPAHANMGTPLMWTGYFHLLIGNLLIGLWEASVLKKRFGLEEPPRRLMIVANYVSAFAGLSLVALGTGLSQVTKGLLLTLGLPLLLLMVALAFGLTVAVEWLFCLRLAGDGPDRKRLAWRMSLTAQAASYAILVPLYLLVAPVNTLFHVRPLASVARPPVATVYYLDARDGDVWRIRTDGSDRERVMAADPENRLARLAVIPGASDEAGDLVLVEKRHGSSESHQKTLREGFAPPGTYARRHKEGYRETDTWMNLQTLYFEPESEREWKGTVGFWAGQGVSVWKGNQPNGEDGFYKIALETPYMALLCRNLTVLPNDQAVLQMGEIIVLLDMPSRRLATLAAGRGPAVLLDRVESEKWRVQNAK